MKLIIRVSGCDDSTEVEGDFTPGEKRLLERVASAVTSAADYGCQPTMRVDLWHASDDDTLRGQVGLS